MALETMVEFISFGRMAVFSERGLVDLGAVGDIISLVRIVGFSRTVNCTCSYLGSLPAPACEKYV